MPSLSVKSSFHPANGVLKVNFTVFLLMATPDLIWSNPVVPRIWTFGFMTVFHVKMKS